MSGCVISPLLRTRDIRICSLINIFLPIHIMTSGLQMSLSSLFDETRLLLPFLSGLS